MFLHINNKGECNIFTSNHIWACSKKHLKMFKQFGILLKEFVVTGRLTHKKRTYRI